MAISLENDMLTNEPHMIYMLHHSTMDGAQLNKQTMHCKSKSLISKFIKN
jgi:hypothetical protein